MYQLPQMKICICQIFFKVWLSYLSRNWYKILDTCYNKEVMFILAHTAIVSAFAQSACSSRINMVEEIVEESCSSHGGWEAKRVQEIPGKGSIPFQAMSPMTRLFLPSPNS